MKQEPPNVRPRKNLWLKPLLLLVLIAVGLVGGWKLYEGWKLKRLVTEARAFTERGEYREAVLSLQRALQINPTSAAATRGMAELTDKLGLPRAVEWRQAAAELSPKSAEDALALATSALRHQKTFVAERALKNIEPEGENTARFHSTAGNTAIAEGHYGPAEEHFAKALQLEPGNAAVEYNLATIRVQSADPKKREDALQSLARLAKGGKVDVLARRTLITRLQREKKWDEALRWSTEQMAAPAVEFRDRLTHLDLLRVMQKPEIEAAITAAEVAFATAPENDAAALVNWLRLAGRAEEAQRWSTGLVPELVLKPAVAMAQAECLIVLSRWADLQTLVQEGDWKDREYARIAYRSRAAREQGDGLSATTYWDLATNAAKNRDQISQLALMAYRWQRPMELRRTLWEAVARPKPEWALQMLHGIYREEGDIEGLLAVAKAALKRDEKNPQARNNVAMLSLLLQQDAPAALKTGQELHQESPNNAVFASTYAFALHVNGRTSEGLAVLKQLAPEVLRDPAVAAYYGLLLYSSGAKEEAAPYLELAKDAVLLPAEKTLLARLTQ